MKLLKRALPLLLAFAMLFALAACGQSGGTEPKNSDAPAVDTPNIGSLGGDNQEHDVSESVIAESLTYGLRNTGWDLAPWKNNGSSGNTIYTQLYATLMANPKFGTALADMQHDMAESYTISDDGLHATVKLKDYIRDSKGNAIGAEDVVFSYETAPNVAGAYANIGVYVDEIKATGDLTVEITISSAAPGVWEYVLSHCPVVNKAWYEGATDEQRSGDPATTGAYKVKENIPGTSVTLEAVEDFWQKDGDRTVYEVATAKIIKCVGISEDAKRVIALENGELDPAWIENTNIKTFADSGEFELFDFYMTNPTTFVFNCAEGSIFHDNADLRQAVLHAIDFEQVRIAASGDFGFQGHDVAPPSAATISPPGTTRLTMTTISTSRRSISRRRATTRRAVSASTSCARPWDPRRLPSPSCRAACATSASRSSSTLTIRRCSTPIILSRTSGICAGTAATWRPASSQRLGTGTTAPRPSAAASASCRTRRSRASSTRRWRKTMSNP